MKLTKKKLDEIVARNLRGARLRRGLTQAIVAKKAGMTVSYISMLEGGRRSPPLLTLAALADALGVTPSSLIEEPRGRKR